MESGLNKLFQICIDSYENRVPVGRIYEIYPEDRGVDFCGLIQFIREIEAMLGAKEPSGSEAVRSFAPVRQPTLKTLADPKRATGSLCTLYIQILYCQNVSWQGVIRWPAKSEERCFRSLLELIMLMDSAICSQDGSQ